MTRKLNKLQLSRETVRELDSKALEVAAGGQQQSLLCTIPPSQCTCTGYYPSWNAPCTN
jgi:hypothetical protein